MKVKDHFYMNSKKQEEYVVKKLENLLDLIAEVYDRSEDFLIAPDYLEVQQVIKVIKKSHQADVDTLARLNKVWKKNKLMQKHQGQTEFIPFDKVVELEVREVYKDSGYEDALGRYQTIWQWDKHQEPTHEEAERMMRQWELYDDKEDPEWDDEDPEDEYDDLPF